MASGEEKRTGGEGAYTQEKRGAKKVSSIMQFRSTNSAEVVIGG